MAIVQEDRLDAPRPEVVKTESGAEMVTAAKESPVVVNEEKVEESPVDVAPAPVEKKPVRKTGRPKKPATRKK